MRKIIEDKLQDLMVAITIITTIVISYMVGCSFTEIRYKKELLAKDQIIFTYEEELEDYKTSNANLIKELAKVKKEIISQDELITENDYLSVRCVELEKEVVKNNNIVNKLNFVESTMTEDEAFLAEYIENGGEIEDIGEWKCTAYCTEKRKHICGTGSGITASGEPVQANWSVAVNKSNLDWLPFGTHIYIEGVGERVVMDTGGGVKKNQFDCANGTHAEALAWSGAGTHKVWILKGESE